MRTNKREIFYIFLILKMYYISTLINNRIYKIINFIIDEKNEYEIFLKECI